MTLYQRAQTYFNKKKYDKCLELCYENTSSAKFYVWLCLLLSFCLDGLSILLSIMFANINNPTIAVAGFAVAVAGVVAVAGFAVAFAGVVAFAFAVAFVLAGALAFAGALVLAGAFAFAGAVAGALVLAGAFAGAFAFAGAVAGAGALVLAGAFALAETLQKFICTKALQEWKERN